MIGGIKSTKEWIKLAHKYNVDWWMTSALESNIGLNAISQFASLLKVKIPQGLGTGSLYHNNMRSPLEVDKGNIFYGKGCWDLSILG